MRTTFPSRSYHPGAAEPASRATADVPAATPVSGSQHALPQAPRTDAVKNASRSPLAMLASARKSLASLRKRLPSMCLGSPITEPRRTQGRPSTPKASMPSPWPQMTQTDLDAQGPASAAPPSYLNPLRPPTRHRAQVATARTPEPTQVLQSHTEERWQQQQSPHRRNPSPPAQRQTGTIRASDRVPVREYEKNGSEDRRRLAQSPVDTDRPRQRQHTFQASPPSPVSPSVSPTSSSPNQRKRETLLDRLNSQLAPYNKLKYEIDTRYDPTPTAEEREQLETRQALIKQRNQVRDIQLNSMLEGLAPMEKIKPPTTTTSGASIVQSKVIDANRRAFFAVKQKDLDMDLIARDYAKARRRIESMKNSAADYKKLKRLERMMDGYQNWLALEQMIEQLNDVLAEMGGPQLTDSDPSTPREREEAKQSALDSHRESMEQGYW
ncbi:type III secretion system effector protein XopR [Xanthomonas axonopodis]|uniref:Type III effector protein XopR n=2 Tax=Xanthomonas axonopodis TaxID=53413 RepID=A0A098Q3X4_9XANT|nr:type III secretion system effector protein XopR [Xanthomonas axonopodis]KGE53598.1 type III effector protein XopR [Xanthomonas axonopodis pv. vasculorum]